MWFTVTFVTLHLNDDAHDTALAVSNIRVTYRDDTTGEETTIFPRSNNNIPVYTISDIDTVTATAAKYIIAAANDVALS